MTEKKTTTKFTITEAHRVTGKSRTTIQKHLKNGKLSFTRDDSGSKLIDLSELVRVYGEVLDLDQDKTQKHGARIQADTRTIELELKLDTVRERLDVMKQERQREREQLAAQIEHLQDALQRAQEGGNRAILLLEDRSRGSDWRSAITDLEERLSTRLDPSPQESKRQTQSRVLDEPWWRLVWR